MAGQFPVKRCWLALITDSLSLKLNQRITTDAWAMRHKLLHERSKGSHEHVDDISLGVRLLKKKGVRNTQTCY